MKALILFLLFSFIGCATVPAISEEPQEIQETFKAVTKDGAVADISMVVVEITVPEKSYVQLIDIDYEIAFLKVNIEILQEALKEKLELRKKVEAVAKKVKLQSPNKGNEDNI